MKLDKPPPKEDLAHDTVEIPLLREDELRATAIAHSRTGRITRDDRGNAIFEVRSSSCNLGVSALDHPGLSLSDVAPVATTGGHGTVTAVSKGGSVAGYNPYSSEPLPRKAVPKPRNLRELSKWIELRNRLAAKDD